METPIIKPNENAVLPRIREIVGIIAGAGSAFVALFWLAGRFYASGYFNAMGIPSFQVSFSIWEYAEVSWFPLIMYSMIVVALGSLITGGLLNIIYPLFTRFDDWLKTLVSANWC